MSEPKEVRYNQAEHLLKQIQACEIAALTAIAQDKSYEIEVDEQPSKFERSTPAKITYLISPPGGNMDAAQTFQEGSIDPVQEAFRHAQIVLLSRLDFWIGEEREEKPPRVMRVDTKRVEELFLTPTPEETQAVLSSFDELSLGSMLESTVKNEFRAAIEIAKTNNIHLTREEALGGLSL